MSAYTKGGWTVGTLYAPATSILDKDGFCIAQAEAIAILEGYDKKLGVRHWANSTEASRDLSDSECEANARLMAAAPELLEALKVVVSGNVVEHPDAVHPSGRFCRACGTNSTEHVHHPNCQVLIAELVIAKAEAQ